MGELFRWEQPKQGLAWTGERFVNGIGGDGRIEMEHLHRYFVARELCRGKVVLDVASGEGYGSSLLAQVASSVVGVDLDASSVAHAAEHYGSSKLRFAQGSAIELPLEPGSVDAVVSFETLEHFVEHEKFLLEVRRVLRPDGFLIVSTPDVSVYSASSETPNPYHVRELTENEFISELRVVFDHVTLLRQRVLIGSAILPDQASRDSAGTMVFERRNVDTFEGSKHLQRAPYLLAVASGAPLTAFSGSVYVHSDQLPPPPEVLQSAQAALQEVSAEVTAVRQEAARRESELAGAMLEVRQQLAEARESHEETQRAFEKVKLEAAAVKEQMDSRMLMADQQDLVARRLQRDLVHRTRTALEIERLEYDLAAARSALTNMIDAHRIEVANWSKAYNDVCGLIIPIWIRKMVPSGLKSSLRGIKRTLRNG